MLQWLRRSAKPNTVTAEPLPCHGPSERKYPACVQGDTSWAKVVVTVFFQARLIIDHLPFAPTFIYSNMSTTSSVVDRRSLAAFIASCPIIDHHAHPLLPLAAQVESDLVATTTEASGPAQAAATTALPYIRAVDALSEDVDPPPGGASANERFQQYWSKRRGFEEDTFTTKSFAGIQTILLDDGLRHSQRLHPYNWHSRFLKSPAKRIVRIETLAEDILQEDLDRSGDAFLQALEAAIKAAIADEEVVGFKSVRLPPCVPIAAWKIG